MVQTEKERIRILPVVEAIFCKIKREVYLKTEGIIDVPMVDEEIPEQVEEEAEKKVESDVEIKDEEEQEEDKLVEKEEILERPKRSQVSQVRYSISQKSLRSSVNS